MDKVPVFLALSFKMQCLRLSPESCSCSCSCYGLPLSIVLVLPSAESPLPVLSRVGFAQAGPDTLQQSRSWPAGAPGQPRPARPALT